MGGSQACKRGKAADPSARSGRGTGAEQGFEGK